MIMPALVRNLSFTFVAYTLGLLGAFLTILGLVDIKTVSLDSGLPTVAMTTPMLAVVIFWAVARVMGTQLDPIRTFLFGGIAVYSLLYACGRLVGNGLFSDGAATIIGALALFGLAFMAISTNLVRGR